MAKEKNDYICQQCGYKTTKWLGRCPNCGTWNSFTESQMTGIKVLPEVINSVVVDYQPRLSTGIGELDRVLGGGIVNGSLILLGGAPGIGKSTLILQVASLFSKKYSRVLYISGEESVGQIKMRAERLNALDDELFVLAETEFDQITSLLNVEKYNLIIIDSIQTIHDPRLDSASGSVTQVKEIANQLLKIAKQKGIPIFLIGHVTKEGELAGPQILEHLVDTVLQFEGDRNYAYRILRAIKNRFGSTNEVGVFEMTDRGMGEVLNPSQLFLEERPQGASGSVVVPVLEGTRPILIEVQSLVSPATFAAPQRLTTGVDYRRVSILLAVLEKKAGFNFRTLDVNVNITGGLKADEPALDLGLVSAIVSSYRDLPLPAELAVVGEIGLAGEIRAVSQIQSRLKELKKLGFKKVILPQGNLKGVEFDPVINLIGIKDIHELLEYIN
jgi:DNA repair protein RadA/Sms